MPDSRPSAVPLLALLLGVSLGLIRWAEVRGDEPVGSAYLRSLSVQDPPFGRLVEDRFPWEGVRIQRRRRDDPPECDWLTVWIDLRTPGLGYRVSPVHYRPGPWLIPIQAGYAQTTLDFLQEHSAPPAVDLAVNTVAYWPFPASRGMPVFLSEPVWQGEDRPDPRQANRVMLGLLPGGAVLGTPEHVRACDPVCAFGSFKEDSDPGNGVAVRDGEVVAEGDEPHARTAVGISGEGRVLVLVVADGYHPGVSVGLGRRDTGRVLRAAGAKQAMFLDGGGSSTLVGREADGQPQVINRPAGLSTTPGTLRHVAANLGFTGLQRTDEPLPAFAQWQASAFRVAWLEMILWLRTHPLSGWGLLAAFLLLLALIAWRRRRRRISLPLLPEERPA